MNESTPKLAAALAAAQGAISPAGKDAKNPHLGNRYADLASVWDACRGPLSANGLSIVQTLELGQPMVLRTTLLHSSGEFISGIVPLIMGEGKGINPMQQLGSAMTYARRYGLSAIVGVVADDDDDGHGSARPVADARPKQRPQEAKKSERHTTATTSPAAPPPATDTLPDPSAPRVTDPGQCSGWDEVRRLWALSDADRSAWYRAANGHPLANVVKLRGQIETLGVRQGLLDVGMIDVAVEEAIRAGIDPVAFMASLTAHVRAHETRISALTAAQFRDWIEGFHPAREPGMDDDYDPAPGVDVRGILD